MTSLKDLFSGGNKPDYEAELWRLIEKKTFELLAIGVDHADVPRLAMDSSCEIMMKKYDIPFKKMVKIAERTISKHC